MFILSLILGCAEPKPSAATNNGPVDLQEDTAEEVEVLGDIDGDGYGDNDCDDNDASIHPNAEEIANDDIDQDCNGADLKTVCEDTCDYSDDGECDDGGTNATYELCELGTDCTDCGVRNDADADGFFDLDDCDDDDSSVNPSMADYDNDGIDQDCNGEDFTGLCTDECNYASDEDCDDGGSDSLFELCELGTDCSDCGPRVDADSDGFDSGLDCMDDNALINPLALDDTCDGIDDNCDGVADEGWGGDIYEPNDDEPYDFEELSESEDIELYAYISHKEDVDSFSFYCQDDSWGPDFGIKVFVDNFPSDMDMSLRILKDGQEIRNIDENGPGGFEIVSLSDDLGEEDSGVYTIEVRSSTGESCEDNYRLTIRETGW